MSLSLREALCAWASMKRGGELRAFSVILFLLSLAAKLCLISVSGFEAFPASLPAVGNLYLVSGVFGQRHFLAPPPEVESFFFFPLPLLQL